MTPVSSHFTAWHVEGKARFQVGNAFFRSQTQVARDLGVLAAQIYGQETGSLRVLDAMAGCGVRSLRYCLESGADWVWANEANPELGSILSENLSAAIAPHFYQIAHLDANQVFFECYNRRDFYDLVDVDCFGSPAPFLSTSLWATKIGGLLYLTNTDGRTVTGHLPEKSLSVYGAYARTHPSDREQGLRLAIGSFLQHAAAKGLGIQPLFSFFADGVYRVMIRLIRDRTIGDRNYGFLGYCHHCGDYQTVSWRKLGRVACPHDGQPLTLSGPMWLGALHDSMWIGRMKILAQEWEWSKQVKLLKIMEAEADLPPYFYTLSEIGRRGKMDTPKRDRLIQALQERGYRATPTHIDARAIKTDADFMTCIAALTVE